MSAAFFPAILWITSVAALTAATIVDVRHRIVPNRLVLVVTLCGAGLRLWSAPEAIWLALLVAVLIVVILGFLAHREWIGGGDAKLIGAVSLLFPTSGVGDLMLNIAIAGGLMGLVYLSARTMILRKLRLCSVKVQERAPAAMRNPTDTHVIPDCGPLLARERERIAAGEPMPYAVAVLGGVLFRLVSEAIQCLSAISCSL